MTRRARRLALVVTFGLVAGAIAVWLGPGWPLRDRGSGVPAVRELAAGVPVRVLIDGSQPRQTIEGFGSYQTSLVYGTKDYLTASQRKRAIDDLYGKVRLNTGNLDGSGLLESTSDFLHQTNDNRDPTKINWAGFQSFTADALQTHLLDLARPLGLDNAYLAPRVNTAYGENWLRDLSRTDPERFMDEAAEQVSASLIYWRDKYHFVSPLVMLFNEPLSGNRELRGVTLPELVQLVTRVGERVRADGFRNVRFIVGNEETEEQSLKSAAAVLSDPMTRPYVGAIGYHTYPYGSPYSSISSILRTSGRGAPVADRVRVRHELRDLGARYGLPVWETEVSDPTWPNPLSFDAFRARAVQIHDELKYANASVYQAMLNMWDARSAREHSSAAADIYHGDGNVVLIDQARDRVVITGMGYAIGQYARWITPGRTVRLEETSDYPLLQVTALRDDDRGRLVLVLINNDTKERTVDVALRGISLSGEMVGEQSTASAYWKPLSQITTTDHSFRIAVPALSVTTVAGPLP